MSQLQAVISGSEFPKEYSDQINSGISWEILLIPMGTGVTSGILPTSATISTNELVGTNGLSNLSNSIGVV